MSKIKEWCQDKVEKGKEWCNNHKFILGYASATIAGVGGIMLWNKIFENKQAGISLGYIENADGSWDEQFGVETWGMDRFGRRHGGHVVKFDQEVADWIADAAHQVVAEIREHNGQS